MATTMTATPPGAMAARSLALSARGHGDGTVWAVPPTPCDPRLLPFAPGLPDAAWRSLVDGRGHDLAVAVAPGAPDWALRSISTRSSSKAARSRATARVLAAAADPDELTRAVSGSRDAAAAAAANPFTPPEALTKLAQRRQALVLRGLAMNPATPAVVVADALGVLPLETLLGRSDDTAMAYAAQIAKHHPTELAEHVANRSVRRAFARSDNCPAKARAGVLDDRGTVTVMTVAGNPGFDAAELRSNHRRLRGVFVDAAGGDLVDALARAQAGDRSTLAIGSASCDIAVAVTAADPGICVEMASRVERVERSRPMQQLPIPELLRWHVWVDAIAAAWSAADPEPDHYSVGIHLTTLRRAALSQLCGFVDPVVSCAQGGGTAVWRALGHWHEPEAAQALSLLGGDQDRWTIFTKLLATWDRSVTDAAEAAAALS